jgi:hypothetical protein
MIRTTWGQVDATSLSDFSRVLTDNITGNQVLLWLLGNMGGIVTRQGKTIVEPLMVDDAASAKWFSGYEPLDMTRTEAATAAEYAWKQLGATHQISGLERFQNGGSGQVIDLWDALGQQVAITMKKKVNVAIPADGSADGGKALIGLQSAIPFDPTNDTYGTLPSASNASWRNFYCVSATTGEVALSGSATSGPDAGDATNGVTNLFNGLREGNVACTAGGDSLDVVLMTKKLYLKMLAGLEGKEQIVREVTSTDQAMANAGFKNVVYMGTPHTWDDDMQPNTNAAGSASAGQGCVGLNLDYAKVVFGEGYEFVFSDPIEPTNQDAIVMKCLAYLNLVLSNRRRHFRINFEFTP